MTPTIDIQKEVQPHFKTVWTTTKPYNVLKGGRNSFKSSVIALKLVFMMIWYITRGEKANIVVIRKVANTIRDSVFLKIQWAINKFGMSRIFDIKVTPFRITHIATGSTFYFYGQDDFQKLKSNDINNIIAVWYEEAAEFDNAEEFDQTNITFMRQKHPLADRVYFFWSYNPPRNPYSWINEWVETLRNNPNYLVDSSSYLDDELGFIDDQILDEINRIKENDKDYYRYLYLGEAVGLGTNVYNMELFHKLDAIPDDDHVASLYFSADTGHAASATAVGAYALMAKRDEHNKPRVILLDTFYYSPDGKAYKKSPSDLSKDIKQFIDRIEQQYHIQAWQYIMDSAEAALRNQMYNDFGIRWIPVKKLKKANMIEYVQSLLAEGRFYYLSTQNNVGMFIPQHEQYQWDEKTVESDDPHVIKVFDHTNDEFQYFVISAKQELQLKY
ncbi:PBSX family phage terminase large subunit [Liquorilactobacillus nagelii]|uniref:PBSX family phage terminase large subunit n=1 Tax=Liquorilactobacillus nagelii TaxID=82688 RepID=UPI001CCFCD11|nr:PBSX family phage terminase large subunit [Liquorilactobacillus nagelii]ULQ49046.1 PBSX family phage terminase large subunit [Liquorilactobacillus nagelii]